MNTEKDLVYVIGHKNPDTDSIGSAIGYASYLNQKRTFGDSLVVAARAGEINPETSYALDFFKVPVPELLEDVSGKKLVLVDHNQRSQSVAGIEAAEVLGVVGHHNIVFDYPNPIYFLTEPVGSTATIVARKFFDDVSSGVKLDSPTAGVLLSAILSDTVIFKSSTTTPKDVLIAEKLSELCGVYDLDFFGYQLKKSGVFKSEDVSELLYHDQKEFDFYGSKISISQIEVVNMEEARANLPDFQAGLEVLRTTGNYSLAVLMITDIMNEGTEILGAGEIGRLEKAFNQSLTPGSFYLPAVMSRKKDFVPELMLAFAQS